MKRISPVVSAGLLSILFILGSSMNPVHAFKEAEKSFSVTATASDKNESLQENDITRFTNAITQIKDYYVQPISDKKLLEDAIRGMLTGLDPHSEYLDEDSYKTLLMTTSGEFGGLGIEVTGEYGVLKVVSPIDDTPASKAGIKSGDYIVAIDGKLVNEMSLREAVDKMRGKKGSPVTLTVLRKGEKDPLTFKLIRDTIHIASIKSNVPTPGYGYIRISQFQQPTTELLIAAVDNLKKANGGSLKGLVIDLRNNPGGLLETAVQVSDVFLDSNKLTQFNKVIVYADGRLPSAHYSAKATGGDILNGAPIVILVNEGSASASEIVAGALQDYRRAIIVGTPSFGKGSVQTVLPLDDTHAIKLTTALYHTPSGRIIQNQGITPDIIIDNLKISQSNKNDNPMMEPIREYGLKGHLKGAADGTIGVVDNSNDAMISLAQTDFQLYEALKILKTITMVDQNNLSLKAPAAAAAAAAAATVAKQP
jgi:carboxyl-terminal processing protease